MKQLKPTTTYCPKCMMEVKTIEKMGGHICSKCRKILILYDYYQELEEDDEPNTSN